MDGETIMPTRRGRICVSIGLGSIAEALVAAKEAAAAADVIEIRLDTLKAPEIGPFVEELETPLLFTNRPVWEGGFYQGDETQRMALLVAAAEGGASFIDLELLASDDSYSQLVPVIRNSDAQLIVSNHNFASTPSREELLDVLQAMKARGADIGKIVTTAHDYRDVLRVLRLQTDADDLHLPLIAFCMGRAGVISRLATLELGGFMTYCALSDNEATASGQIPVQRMRSLLQSLRQT